MKQKTKKIVLTGGGTAGHVMPNLALVPDLQKEGWEILYIGSNGIEKELVQHAKLPFYEIKSGKMRRYFSFKNFTDIFKIIFGVVQAFGYLKKLRPSVVFSKGGFVAVPVAIAAKFLHIPVVSHESDITPGLANKIIARFAAKILCAFPSTLRNLPLIKSEWVGTPIRKSLFSGNKHLAEKFLGVKINKKVILVMGGSLGAQNINQLLEKTLEEITKEFFVVHITGKGKALEIVNSQYRQFEFIGEELKDIYALADIIISRAGANSIFEFLALKKPMILIPLEQGSRGDQILNAAEFQKQGWAVMVREAGLTPKKLLETIADLAAKSKSTTWRQMQFNGSDTNEKIMEILNAVYAASH